MPEDYNFTWLYFTAIVLFVLLSCAAIYLCTKYYKEKQLADEVARDLKDGFTKEWVQRRPNRIQGGVVEEEQVDSRRSSSEKR